MKLIRINNYKLEVEDEILLLTPFKELYKTDKTKNKDSFYEFLTILYYVYDPRSDYNYIVDEQERIQEVCESNGIQFKKFSGKEEDCISLYKKLTCTTSSLLLEDTKAAVENVRKMLRSIDFDALEEKDKVVALKNVTSVTALIPKLVKDLTEAERAVTKEIEESGRARGGNSKKLMEDGIML